MKLPAFLSKQNKASYQQPPTGEGKHEHTSRSRGPVGAWPLVLRNVQGHSMMPVLPPGTLVVGARYFRELKQGDVVIFLHEGREKIKRIDQMDEQRIFVLGDLPDASTDSRHFGWISRDAVLAKVVWPRDVGPIKGY